MDATTSKARKDPDRLAFPLLILWGLAYVGARIGLELVTGPGPRVVLALLPIPFFLGFMFVALRAIDRGDEMYRRAHLEALAVAFPLTVVMLMVLGLFELATGLNPNDWSYRHTWPIVVIFYYVGWLRAWKRYQ